jgi:hypothetical protein
MPGAHKKEKALDFSRAFGLARIISDYLMVGATRFELATTRPPV